MNYSLRGTWTATLHNSNSYPCTLPGTLDESSIGFPDAPTGQVHPDEAANETLLAAADRITTRFTRKHTYTGLVRFSKEIALPKDLFSKEQPRIFLKAERARCLALQVNGTPVPVYRDASLSTPYLFELTPVLANAAQQTLVLATSAPDTTTLFTLESDNSYPGLPADAILCSSAATDETQTNWNGILGEFCLYTKEAVFISSLRVYPVWNKATGSTTLTVKLTLDAAIQSNEAVTVTLSSPALPTPVTKEITLAPGINGFTMDQLPLAGAVSYWDEDEGNLYELTAALSCGARETVTFGIRHFAAENGHFTLNGRRVFLRSEANCAVFPETGHPPMTVAEWEEILRRYRSYGVNHLRFHSHCPPEAAFTAADRLGMLLQPELSQWDPWHALESEESFTYYRQELRCILHQLANHPSFVMLTMGNELHSERNGHDRMRELVLLAKETDSTRLYSNGSNVEYGWFCDAANDFYTTQQHFGKDNLRATFASQDKEKRRLEGYLNNRYPDARTQYTPAIEAIRATYSGPVFSFEVGQYEILPDFDELNDFHGVTRPGNLAWIKESVEHAGLLPQWKRYVEATGELSLLAYREEVEAALRTGELSGISLLGLQDFPGQGTALVGMLNSHLQPKPYPFATPERFRAFFTGQLPLVLLPKYTYTSGETLEAEVAVANYGKACLKHSLTYNLTENVPDKINTAFSGDNTAKQPADSSDASLLHGTLPEVSCPCGTLTRVGTIRIPLKQVSEPAKLTLEVCFGSLNNSYPVWVYPDITPVCPATVYETRHLDTKAQEVLSRGGTVYLSPNSTKEQLPNSIQGQFSTDFWSVGTFPAQEGGMGLLIDEQHPVFAQFPTEFHTNWQWWPMANQRAVILPKQYDSIITQLDSYAYLRPMAMLLECRCGNGKLLFSTMGLQNLQDFPEAQALLHSIYTYLASEEFQPGQEISPEVLESLVN